MSNDKLPRRQSALNDSGRFDAPIVTSIEDAAVLLMPKKQHRQFYKKNSLREYMMRCHVKAYQKKYWSDKDTS